MAMGAWRLAGHESPRESPPNACGADPAPGLVLRDYFVARGSLAVLLWIFRERLAQPGKACPDRVDSGNALPDAQWYLHGLFA